MKDKITYLAEIVVLRMPFGEKGILEKFINGVVEVTNQSVGGFSDDSLEMIGSS